MSRGGLPGSRNCPNLLVGYGSRELFLGLAGLSCFVHGCYSVLCVHVSSKIFGFDGVGLGCPWVGPLYGD